VNGVVGLSLYFPKYDLMAYKALSLGVFVSVVENTLVMKIVSGSD
jgi:hypothetical protein